MLLSVHLGGSAEFRCEIGSHPQAGPHFVTWYKDGRQLPGTGRQSEVLRISSIGREDRGMYQCIVRRSEGDTAQSSAELQLGGMLLLLLSSSSSKSLVLFHPAAARAGDKNTRASGPRAWINTCSRCCCCSRGDERARASAARTAALYIYSERERKRERERRRMRVLFLLSDAPPVLLYSFIEQTLQPGPAVSLKCSAAGNPTPQISWALDGFPLPTNGRYVYIRTFTHVGEKVYYARVYGPFDTSVGGIKKLGRGKLYRALLCISLAHDTGPPKK